MLLAAALILPACKDNLQMSEMRGLQGRWHLVKEVHNGVETPKDEIRNGYLTFDAENIWRVEANGKPIGGGQYVIDSDKYPKTIDYTFSEGEEKGQTFRAIYEASTDSFIHCGVMNGERPKTFSAEAGSENYLVTFERIK
jgi:uncharacterized protein (TIGR03067 family)